jgi:hypothetical protein
LFDFSCFIKALLDTPHAASLSSLSLSLIVRVE